MHFPQPSLAPEPGGQDQARKGPQGPLLSQQVSIAGTGLSLHQHKAGGYGDSPKAVSQPWQREGQQRSGEELGEDIH